MDKPPLEQIMRLTLGQHTSMQLFEEFFSPEVYNVMTRETVCYSTEVSSDHKFQILAKELKVFRVI